VVSDIEGGNTAELRQLLDAVPGTIRSRVLF
jgi:hypothetical protein